MTTITDSILEKIEKKKIQPKTKRYFAFRNAIVWLMTGVALLITGFLCSAVFVMVSNGRLVSAATFLAFVLVAVLLLVLSLYLGYRQFIQIKKSHRAKLRYVLLGSLIVLFVLGSLFAHGRAYSRIDRIIGEHVPVLSIQNRIDGQWSEPEGRGKLAVEVLYIDDEGYVYGEDFRKKLHVIDPLLLSDGQRQVFVDHLRVRMIGFPENGIFYPDMVTPWQFQFEERTEHPEYGLPLRKGNINFTE